MDYLDDGENILSTECYMLFWLEWEMFEEPPYQNVSSTSAMSREPHDFSKRGKISSLDNPPPMEFPVCAPCLLKFHDGPALTG